MTDPRVEPAAIALLGGTGEWLVENESLRNLYRDDATRAIAAIDKAATIATVEELDALPVGSRVVMGDYYILREEHSVDDGAWLDLGNGLRLDADDLRIIIESYPARVIHWGTE